MPPSIAEMAPVFRLARVSTAFAAVADVWFVILWTRANPEEAGGAWSGVLGPGGPARGCCC